MQKLRGIFVLLVLLSGTFSTNLAYADDSPVITLLGDNPQTILLGAGYSELSATATDTEDDNTTLTASIVVDSTAFVDAVGSYPVHYDVTDMAGNPADRVTRTVDVITNDSPVITLLGDNPQTILLGAGYSELSATATDTEDDNTTLTASIVVDSTAFVDAVGSYPVHYDVTDMAGNPADRVTRTVDVILPDSKVTQMGLVIDTLTDLKDTTDDKTDKKIDKIIKRIDKAMNSKYWDESGTELTSKKGKKVFDESKKAVKDLSKISKKSDVVYPEIASSIGLLVGITHELATDAIDDAQAHAGDKKADKEIKKSIKEMNKAQKELEKGKPDKAIDKYKKAWEHAQKALKKKK